MLYSNNDISVSHMICNTFYNNLVQLDACTEEMDTYAELQNKIVKCALWLQKQEIKSNDVISICTGNHLNAIVPCISAAYVNAIFNPWNENMNLRKFLRNNNYQIQHPFKLVD